MNQVQTIKMQQLSRLVLKGYKSIKKMDIELNNLNVFIGANGAGKSRVIKNFLKQELIRSGGQSRMVQNGKLWLNV
jgi:predicted ATPase